ncbi:MAG: CDP-alcohol phosphatidyltransferase family protein, partial [Sphingomonas sp.]
MLTLPNILTLSRIVAVPLLAWLLWLPGWHVGYALAFALYCLMGVTDYFDGYLARAWGSISRLGQFLDPIADKIMVASVLVMLMASRKADGDVPII